MDISILSGLKDKTEPLTRKLRWVYDSIIRNEEEKEGIDKTCREGRDNTDG